MESPTSRRNGVRSGPGPLKTIYEKIAALESEVSELKSELRLVKRKLQTCEKNGSVKDAIVDQIKDSQFSVQVMLTPISSDESIRIIQPDRDPIAIAHSPKKFRSNTSKTMTNRSPSKSPKISVNKGIFDDNNESRVDLDMDMEMDREENDQDVRLVLDPVFDPTIDIKNFEHGVGSSESGDGEATRPGINDSEYIISGSDSENPSKTPQSLYSGGSVSEYRSGRGRDLESIWNFYEVSIGPGGKKIAVCRACKKKVSAKAVRLKHHRARNCKAKK